MEWIVVSVVLATAYVYAPLLRVHAARRMRLPLPPGAVAPAADAVAVPAPEVPEAVRRWCEQWRDEWAREEALAEAQRLYAITGDWNEVLVKMEQTA